MLTKVNIKICQFK